MRWISGMIICSLVYLLLLFSIYASSIRTGFHNFWLDQATKQIPILLVRYEDILANRDDVTRQMIEFMGEKRAPVECLVENSRTATLYKPRNKTKEGKAEQWFSKAARDAMRTKLKTRLCEFGYEKDMDLDCSGITPIISLLPGTNKDGKVGASVRSRRVASGCACFVGAITFLSMDASN
jgi:hypothetical protein